MFAGENYKIMISDFDLEVALDHLNSMPNKPITIRMPRTWAMQQVRDWLIERMPQNISVGQSFSFASGLWGHVVPCGFEYAGYDCDLKAVQIMVSIRDVQSTNVAPMFLLRKHNSFQEAVNDFKFKYWNLTRWMSDEYGDVGIATLIIFVMTAFVSLAGYAFFAIEGVMGFIWFIPAVFCSAATLLHVHCSPSNISADMASMFAKISIESNTKKDGAGVCMLRTINRDL